MKNNGFIALLLALSGLFCACIRNDIPYPVVVAGIESIDVENAIQTVIDGKSQSVSIVLDETADIRKVKIESVTYSTPQAKPSWDITGERDLSVPIKLTLSTYQDYVWTISARQPIERFFSLEGQISESVIDSVNHRVYVSVAASADLENMTVSSFKLGPRDISSCEPDPQTVKDFSDVVRFTLSWQGKTESWDIYVEKSELNLEFSAPVAWAKVAYFSATGTSLQTGCGFRFREKGSSEWTVIDAQPSSEGLFSASAEGLSPETDYEAQAFCGEDESGLQYFRTEAAPQLPNPGFECFSNAESSKYYSFYDPQSSSAPLQVKWWDSGNKGSTTIGSRFAITMPDAQEKTEGNNSVKLASTYVIIKFAAGNVFSGEYYKTIGTSGGVIRLGRPFSSHPRSLSVDLKYKCGKISNKTLSGMPEGDPVKVGDNDRCVVWVALGDWDYRKYGGSPECPVEVNTNDRSSFFDRNGENVIAYGEYVSNKSTEGWMQISIPLEYKSLTRKPTHIIVSAAASLLGDYFTGSEDSILWMDNLKLEY